MCEYHMQQVVNYLKFKSSVEKRNIEQVEIYIRSMNDEKKSIESKIEKLNAELAEIRSNMSKAQSNLMKYNTKLKKYNDTVATLEELIND